MDVRAATSGIPYASHVSYKLSCKGRNGTYATGWVVETFVETFGEFGQVPGNGRFLVPGPRELHEGELMSIPCAVARTKEDRSHSC